MNIKALIQSHYPERIPNVIKMVNDLIKNGLSPRDIIILADHEGEIFTPAYIMRSQHPMPINWWHGVGAILDCDWMALLCDDLTLRERSIEELKLYTKKYPSVNVFGFEGGNLAYTPHAYSGGVSKSVKEFEKSDYVLRFYFTTPLACLKALTLYKGLPKQERIHDDLILSLANKCGIVPVSKTVGWDELPEYHQSYSGNANHYKERDSLCNYMLLQKTIKQL